MTEYHKIITVWNRDPATKHRTLIEGVWATPEIEYLADCDWEWTEKVDGTNIRVISDGTGSVTFGGKTNRAQIPATLVTKLQDLFLGNMELQNLGPCVLYGEGYGAKIQGGGGYIPDGQDFILFDVKIGEWWLRRADIYDVADKLGIKDVPVMKTGPLTEAIELVRNGLGSLLANRPAEGLVMRPLVDLFDRQGGRIITKIKCRDFQPTPPGEEQ